MVDLLADFYRQNEWANITLLDVCRRLTEEQLDTTAPGTYGTIRETLRHIVNAEAGYAFGREDAEAERVEPDDTWPGFDRLAELVHATAAVATRRATEYTGDLITVDLPDEPSDVDPAVIFVQMAHHGTDHRSQISTILTTLGVEPPDLSSWSWGLAAGRVTCGICGSKEHYGADH